MPDYQKINCQNCKFYDDIMYFDDCKGCSLLRSKPGEVIKFEPK